MAEPLDESYLNWLYSQVATTRSRTPSKTYWNLLRLMYTVEFVWFIPNDDNRVEDGRDLRREFFLERAIRLRDSGWMDLNCSFLEMAIGLSRRLSFEAGQEPAWWFWKLMENLDLHEYSDAKPLPKDIVRERLDAVVWRTYEPNGDGGLFPLKNPPHDQRSMELWYQLNTYLIENEYV